MKARLIQIGNSRGIRIPKSVIDQCEFKNEVELEINDRQLIIKSDSPRSGWKGKFQQMGADENEQLFVSEPMNDWDTEEWEW